MAVVYKRPFNTLPDDLKSGCRLSDACEMRSCTGFEKAISVAKLLLKKKLGPEEVIATRTLRLYKELHLRKN